MAPGHEGLVDPDRDSLLAPHLDRLALEKLGYRPQAAEAYKAAAGAKEATLIDNDGPAVAALAAGRAAP